MKIQRRQFIEHCGLVGGAIVAPTLLHALLASPAYAHTSRELRADVVIIGGGLGGCAAALAACRQGRSVILTEPTDWIGGQLSQQAVPPDEHQWIESFGRTPDYANLRCRIRDYYRRNYPLVEAASSKRNFNPGNGLVSRICHEPLVGVAVLQEMLAANISSGRLTLLLNTQPVSADIQGDSVSSVNCNGLGFAGIKTLHGRYFIDASEEGDLLPLTGTEFVIGAESHSETGEPHAPQTTDATNIQSFTYCFAIDHLAGEDHTIDKPDMYDYWKEHVPPLTPPWSGKLLALSYSNPRTLAPRELAFVPCGRETPAPRTKALNLWLYRRMLDRANFTSGHITSDVTLVNWPQNDYMLGNITNVPPEQRQQHLHRAKQLSLSLLYWMQTEAPRPDGGEGWSGLRLRKDLVGTEDGLAKHPYIRESRRIRAEITVTEQDISYDKRLKETKSDQAAGKNNSRLLARPFTDSAGIGYYHLDLHPSSGGDNYIDTGSVPFQIPLGSLIPQRVNNLLAGCKNIGTTHLSNGCYRLHPVEWAIGAAAGEVAAYALNQNTTPRAIRNHGKSLTAFQTHLTGQGIELDWSRLNS